MKPRAQRGNRPGNFRWYRGYQCTRRKGGFGCRHHLVSTFPHLPVTFSWTSPDELRLRSYIDALYHRDHDFTRECEEKELATEHTFQTETAPRERLEVNAKRLFDALSLTDRMDVPLWSHFRFVTDGHRLVPAAFIAELVQAHPGFADLDPQADWHLATEADLSAMGLKPEQVTSGMYRQREPRQPEAAAAQPPVPPRERRVKHLDHRDFVELITQTIPDSGAAWYTRRLYTLNPQRVFYAATSWEPIGPWTVYQRDPSVLMALGIDV